MQRQSESEAWLRDLRSGGVQALVRLYEHHRPRLERMLWIHIGAEVAGRYDVLDVCQEAYLDAVCQLEDYLPRPEHGRVHLVAVAGLEANDQVSAISGWRHNGRPGVVTAPPLGGPSFAAMAALVGATPGSGSADASQGIAGTGGGGLAASAGDRSRGADAEAFRGPVEPRSGPGARHQRFSCDRPVWASVVPIEGTASARDEYGELRHG